MNRTVQSLLMALLGGLMIAITVTGRYTSYVKPNYGPLLVLSGIVPGERVATRANFLLDSESRLRGAIETAGARP